MHLHDLVLFHPPYTAENLPKVTELVSEDVRQRYYDFIWEPCNRHTFARPDIESRIERDPFPIPHATARDHYFAGRDVEYWISGLTDALMATEWVAAHKKDHPIERYLDFGCSSGRVVRHFLCQNFARSCHGTDLNTGTIQWAQQHIPAGIFLNNTIIPHLPFPDAYFDLITAYSVFTHIDLLEEAWLLELRRVLRPGGTIALSNHSEAVWSSINPDHFMFEALKNSQPTENIEITPEIFSSGMPFPRFGFVSIEGVANEINMFRSRNHIREAWGRIFTIEAIIERGHLFHDLIFLSHPEP